MSAGSEAAQQRGNDMKQLMQSLQIQMQKAFQNMSFYFRLQAFNLMFWIKS